MSTLQQLINCYDWNWRQAQDKVLGKRNRERHVANCAALSAQAEQRFGFTLSS